MASPNQQSSMASEQYSSLEAVDGVPRSFAEHHGLHPLERKPDPTAYPEALFEVDRVPPEDLDVPDEELPTTKKPTFISRRWLWLIAVILIAAAVAGGAGDALASKHSKALASSQSSPTSGTPASTTSSSSLSSPSTTALSRTAAQIGTSISSINWGAGSTYQLRVYFQGNDSFIYESTFAAGNWTSSSPKRIVKAKPSTPITSMFYPSDGSGNVSITLCFLSEQNIITEHLYDGTKWDTGHLGVSVQFEALNSSSLSGTLLRQPQPGNGNHTWEPYVLYYQQKDYNFRELVQTASGWISSIYFGVTAYKGSPVTVIGGDNGYTLQLFYLRANDTQLLGFNATRETLNASNYDADIYVLDNPIARAWPTTGSCYSDGRFGNPWTDFIHNSSNCSALTGMRLPRLSFSLADDITAETTSWLQCLQAGGTFNSYVYGRLNRDNPAQDLWTGSRQYELGFGGRGLAVHPESAIAAFYDQGSGNWPCRQGVVYQNLQGDLDSWGSPCSDGVWDANGTLPRIL